MSLKRFLGLFIVAIFIITAVPFTAFADYYDNVPQSDVTNNELFNVVAKIREVSAEEVSPDAKILDANAQYDEETKDVYIIKEYSDGSRVKEIFANIDLGNGYPYLADEGFPSFLEKNEYNTIDVVNYVNDGEEAFFEYSKDENGNLVKKHLYTVKMVKSENNESNYYLDDSLYNVYKIDEITGEEKIIDGSPYSYDEYNNLGKITSEYNDGIKFIRDESGYEYKFVDVNGNEKFSTMVMSYYGMDYNLGYILENYNNGGSIDWSSESDRDPELDREFETYMTDITSNARFYFKNANLNPFDDNGYAVMSLKGNDGYYSDEYLVKLKRPVIVSVMLDNKKILFDQLPIIEDGRTLVPLRAIFEAIGAEVNWDESTKTVTATKGDNTVSLTIDSKTAVKNGENIALDVPAKIVGGRTMVPVRFIADSFNVETGWDDSIKQVILTSK